MKGIRKRDGEGEILRHIARGREEREMGRERASEGERDGAV